MKKNNGDFNMEKEFKLFMDVWGEQAQIMMCIEEMSELTKELCKYLRYNDKSYTNNIIEELADVKNCIEQLTMHFGKDKVEQMQKQKIDRTVAKICGEGINYQNSVTKVFELDDVVLRPFKYTDAQDMFNNYCNDDEVTKYLPWATHKNLQVTQDYLKSLLFKYNRKDFFEWAIVDKHSNQVIGAISFTPKGNQSGELGYVLSKKMWGRAILPRSAKIIKDYVFSLGYQKMFAKCQLENSKSERVMQKLEMEFEGISRKCDYNNKGELTDFKVYSIINKG